MPVRRKVFRIEQMTSPAIAPANTTPTQVGHQDVAAELKALRELIERPTTNGALHDAVLAGSSGLSLLRKEADNINRAIARTKHEIATVHVRAFDGAANTHIAHQLDAVAESAERATQRILDAAEEIEEAANSLAAGLKREQERALAQDIQDHAVRIFEACNFQDLSGQRLNKVIATLQFVEERIAHMMTIWGGLEAFKDYTAAALSEQAEVAALHGPRLDSDVGHATQDDVDRLFATD